MDKCDYCENSETTLCGPECEERGYISFSPTRGTALGMSMHFPINSPEIREGAAGQIDIVGKLAIQFANMQDQALVNAIRAKAIEEGVTDLYVLDDAAVLAAIRKAVPMEIPPKNIHVDEYYCPACYSENNCDQGKVGDDYCPRCGQRIFQIKQEDY